MKQIVECDAGMLARDNAEFLHERIEGSTHVSDG